MSDLYTVRMSGGAIGALGTYGAIGAQGSYVGRFIPSGLLHLWHYVGGSMAFDAFDVDGAIAHARQMSAVYGECVVLRLPAVNGCVGAWVVCAFNNGELV